MLPITVMIVDDHQVVRLGLSALLSNDPEFRLVGEARSGQEALQLVEHLNPQLVLMDVRMPGLSGIETCREIVQRRPETRVIMLTSYADKNAAMASIMAGASGYLLKQVSGEELLQAARTVAKGGDLVDPMLAREVFAQLRSGISRPAGEESLTEQERQVLALVGEGKTNREIGQLLFLSEKTVRNYVSNVLQKLGLVNRTQAATHVVRHQLLESDS